MVQNVAFKYRTLSSMYFVLFTCQFIGFISISLSPSLPLYSAHSLLHIPLTLSPAAARKCEFLTLFSGAAHRGHNYASPGHNLNLSALSDAERCFAADELFAPIGRAAVFCIARQWAVGEHSLGAHPTFSPNYLSIIHSDFEPILTNHRRLYRKTKLETTRFVKTIMLGRLNTVGVWCDFLLSHGSTYQCTPTPVTAVHTQKSILYIQGHSIGLLGLIGSSRVTSITFTKIPQYQHTDFWRVTCIYHWQI